MKRLFNILLFAALIYPGFSKAQEFIINSYNTHDGLVQSSVADIFQDKYGMMWFFTETGISAFDGIEFYNYIDSVSLFDSWLVKACADSSGNVFMLNVNGEVWRWDKKTFERVNLPRDIAVTTVNVSEQNELLVGTINAGLFIRRDDEWISITNGMGLYSDLVTSISVMNNITFVASSNGLNKLIKDKPVKLFSYDNLNVRAVLLDSRGRFWLGTGGGLYVYENNNLHRVNNSPALIEDLGEDKWGNIWIAGRRGLFRISGEQGNHELVPVITDTDSRTIYIDREGIVWTGSIGKGVFTIKHNLFKSIKQKSGFSLRSPFPIHEDEGGRVWIGTDHGLVTFSNRTWQVIEALKGKIVINLFEDDRGDLWIINPAEIYKYSNGRLELAVDYEALPSSKRFVSQLKDGTIIIGTSDDGLWELSGDEVVKSELNKKLNGEVLYSSFKDSSGNVWIGTNNSGIIKIADGEIIKLDSGKGITAEYIFQFSEDRRGNIWAGTTDGVYVIDKENKINKYTTEDGLVSNTCYSIIAYQDYVFVGTSDGLNLIDGNAIELFTSADGLLNNDCNTGAFLIDSRSNLWIGTYDGISIMHLPGLLNSKRTIACAITKISTGDTIYDLIPTLSESSEKHFVFSSSDEPITITTAGLYFTRSTGISYKYKILGEGYERVVTTTNRKLELSNLAPGEYEIIAEAKTAGVPAVESINKLRLTIEPQFYQTTLFYLFLVLLIMSGGSVYLYIKGAEKKRRIADKYKTSSLTKENYNRVREKVTASFDEEKVYHDPELTLPKLASELNIHKEYISQVINKGYQKNFNEFVNSYRIEEAKVLLTQTGKDKLSILSIALEVGFNSKTTFNLAFKKQTGQTPTEYRYANTK